MVSMIYIRRRVEFLLVTVTDMQKMMVNIYWTNLDLLDYIKCFISSTLFKPDDNLMRSMLLSFLHYR